MSNHRGNLLTFLPLGPVTSNSYPKTQEVRPSAAEATHKRRTSSLSSTAGFRVLKVAPVHYGEHSGDCQQDWTLSPASSTSSEPAAVAGLSFLSLSPVTSASFPKAPTGTQKRRTSSLSSDGKPPSGFRVLKVAPVHYGEHGGDHQEDWHEVPEVAVE